MASIGRTCSEPVAGLTASQIHGLLFKPVVNRGVIDYIGNSANVAFERYTNAQYAAKQPFGFASFGDCMVYNYRNVNLGLGNPIQPDPLDAGPSISLTTPNGKVSLPFQDGQSGSTVERLPRRLARVWCRWRETSRGQRRPGGALANRG